MNFSQQTKKSLTCSMSISHIQNYLKSDEENFDELYG